MGTAQMGCEGKRSVPPSLSGVAGQGTEPSPPGGFAGSTAGSRNVTLVSPHWTPPLRSPGAGPWRYLPLAPGTSFFPLVPITACDRSPRWAGTSCWLGQAGSTPTATEDGVWDRNVPHRLLDPTGMGPHITHRPAREDLGACAPSMGVPTCLAPSKGQLGHS